jgi:glycerol-3-phosphate cytidylyltransferase
VTKSWFGCSTDEFNTQKGKKCVVPFSERVEVLNACKYVSKVFPEDSWDQKVSDIQRVGADIFAMEATGRENLNF